MTKHDFWKNWTEARIDLGRTGHALRTPEVLALRWAHALAKDAVLTPWDVKNTRDVLQALGEKPLILSSKVENRDDYLKRPDLGRKLKPQSTQKLSSLKSKQYDLVFIISDGLSSAAINKHLLPFWSVLKAHLAEYSLKIAPPILVPFARVAISDDVGFAIGAKLSVILLGERPGLSTPDSLSAYLTYDPKPENTDALRNCISNICPPKGCSHEKAAQKLLYLIRESLQRKLSGVSLKEESDAPSQALTSNSLVKDKS